MKKLLLTLALVGVAAVAFGQGTVNFNNGTTLANAHQIILGPDASRLAADVGWVNTSYGGTAVYTAGDSGGNIPSGKIIEAGLYAGTDVGSLTLVTTVPVTTSLGSLLDGTFPQLAVTLGSIAPGATGTFQIGAWDSTYASFAAARAGGGYAGISAVFTSTTGGVGTPPSTAVNLNNAAGWVGPIVLTVPEPSLFALAGLGAAALLVFRRRK